MFIDFNIYNKKWLFSLIKQFIKFGIVGISNTIISLIIYYAFILINKDLYILGNTVGFIVSVLNAYYWNHKYVFNTKEKGNLKYILKTYMAYGCTFLLGTGLLYIMVDLLNISKFLAPLINLLITVPLNFFINKYWTFS